MYTVIPTEQFEKDVKYYIKKKGFTHIGADIKAITDELEKGNLIGAEIPGLRIPTDGHTFKVRSANTDTKAGQSNGYRIIYYAVRDDAEVYLLTIKRMIAGYHQSGDCGISRDLLYVDWKRRAVQYGKKLY